MFNSAFAAFVTLTYAATVFFAIVFYAVGSMRRMAYRHYIRNYRKKSVAFSSLSHAQVLTLFQDHRSENNHIFEELYDVYVVARGDALLLWKRFFLSKAQVSHNELDELVSWIGIEANDFGSSEIKRLNEELTGGNASKAKMPAVWMNVYRRPARQYSGDYVIDIEALLAAIYHDYQIREADNEVRNQALDNPRRSSRAVSDSTVSSSGGLTAPQTA